MMQKRHKSWMAKKKSKKTLSYIKKLMTLYDQIRRQNLKIKNEHIQKKNIYIIGVIFCFIIIFINLIYEREREREKKL